MQYRQLGTAGVRVSVIGLGTNQFGGKVDQAGVDAIIGAALDAGVNLIDTADVYRDGLSETTLGKALQGKRQQVVLATKAYNKVGDGPNEWGTSRLHLTRAVEYSLRRLQTDYIDLYQMHRPDDTTPIEETLRALDDLVRSGKVRYIGTSNYPAWKLARANVIADVHGWTPFASEQGHYHMFEREAEKEMLPFCQKHGVGFIPYFPLAGGFLTGKYKRGQDAPDGSRGESSPYVQRYMTDANYTVVEKLSAWSEARDRNMVQLAHAWLLAQPAVSSVISGATKVSQVEQNAKAGDWQLSAEELEEVNAVLGAA